MLVLHKAGTEDRNIQIIIYRHCKSVRIINKSIGIKDQVVFLYANELSF